MNDRLKSVLYEFVVGTVLVEIPVITTYLIAAPAPDPKILAAGLLGGLAATIKEYLSPTSNDQLVAETVANPVALPVVQPAVVQTAAPVEKP